jgi:hypothetical protein
MALDVSKVGVIELDDVKVAVMSADASSSPTYETAIDVPGIVRMKVTPELHYTEQEGDGYVMDSYGKVKAAAVEFEAGCLPLSVVAALLGVTADASGSTPNQTTTVSVTKTTVLPSFKIEGRWTHPGEGLGDAHLVLYKCKLNGGGDLEAQHGLGEFAGMALQARAIPTISDGKLYDVVVNETATAIAIS